MSQLERYIQDPVGALRGLWDDIGWRTVLIAGFLIFWLETSVALAGSSVINDSVVWLGMELTLVLIVRIVVGRSYSGDLRDPANMTVLLAIITLAMAEVAAALSGGGDWLAAQTISWPYSLIAIFCLVVSRLLAPVISQPANVFTVLFIFFTFWLETADWLAGASVPASAGYVRWAVAMVALALIARGIVGRGFGGSITSTLNLTALFTIVGILWVEIGMYFAGGGGGFAAKALAWPWQLLFIGTALIARVAAGYLSSYIAARSPSGEPQDAARV